MPAIRIAALGLIFFAALLAITSVIPGSGVDTIPPAGLLVMMAVIAGNAAGVLWLTREPAAARLGITGLWLVLAGAGFAVALATVSLWIGLFVAPAAPEGGLDAVIVTINATAAVVSNVMMIGAAALVAGWSLWVAAWLLARRRAA